MTIAPGDIITVKADDIFGKPLFEGKALFAEIRRQRRAIFKKRGDPKVLYLGTEEYAEFRREVGPYDIYYIHGYVDPERGAVETGEAYEGMEIIRRLKPGVHVCEAAP